MAKLVAWVNLVGTEGACEILELKRKSDLRVLRKRDPDFPQPDKWLSSRCPAWDGRRLEAYKRRPARTR